MPEGHTIHRLAGDHAHAFVGRRVGVSSPQGRFADGARLLDGRTLAEVEAHGKHLFYRWEEDGEGAGEALHVHLGLVGTFRTFHGDAPAPTSATRLALRADGVVAYLAGPAACELLDPAGEEALRARLGPDPLRAGADPSVAYAALGRRRGPIGAALLDQRVLAGVGNAYRAEALFVCGIDPHRPAASLDRGEFDDLWETLAGMLRRGVADGRIDTTGDGGRFVYRRAGEACRRCGATITGQQMAGRTLFACPGCQGGTAPTSVVG